MKRSTSQRSSPPSPSSPTGFKKSKLDSRSSPNLPPPSLSQEGWTRVEKRSGKKKDKKAAKQLENNQPRFLYSNSEITKRENPIGIDEIRDLVLHVTIGAGASRSPPHWVRVDNTAQIQRTLVLMIPGVTPEMLSLPPPPTVATKNPNIPISIPLPSKVASGIPWIASTFSHACPTRAPGDSYKMHSVYSTFFSAPVSIQEKQRRDAMKALASSAQKSNDPARYILTTDLMIDNDYPIPTYLRKQNQPLETGWIQTPEVAKPSLITSSTSQTPSRKVYALDCEMCMTEDGKALTRVCVIDFFTSSIILDQLVMPPKPITDYLTRWSGITPQALLGVTTTLADVQKQILKLLSPPPKNPFSTNAAAVTNAGWQTPVLIGHSLENDLGALKLRHPYVIDTSLLYHHPRGRPLKPGLAWLMKKWCGKEIQNRGEGGHDPTEDALACIDLVRKKLDSPEGFGEFKADQELIFEKMSRLSRPVKTAVIDHGNPSAMHGAKATTCVACTTDEEVVEGVIESVKNGHQFIFGRLKAVAECRGWISPRDKDSPVDRPTELPPPPSSEDLASSLSTLNANLQKIHASLPLRTALVIFTGHSDPRPYSLLTQRKYRFEDALRKGILGTEGNEETWTQQDARDLEAEVEKARQGLLFLGVKA